MHYRWKGKIEIASRTTADTKEALSLAYTPGVAQPCLEIQKDIDKSYDLTRRWNTVAVITDGSAVLGLGNIGPEAGMPVMEGKCLLFKEFGGVDAIPLCIRSQNVDEFVRTVELLLGSFGGVNLEDISAPRCFEIERKLQAVSDIPIFHDDQHGTAVVVAAGVLNALKVAGKKIEEITVCICGAGAAGCAIGRMLLDLGAGDVIFCDKDGILQSEDPRMDPERQRLLKGTNKTKKEGFLPQGVEGADVFVGVSAPGLLTGDMVKTMKEKAIVFAMANPTPEIFPEEALKAGALVVGTGRSDYPNQVNNVLAFPGIFRGTLDARAKAITKEMKMAAAYALAGLVSESELSPTRILPDAFDPRVAATVAKAVAGAWKEI
ncbi:MAG: NADP-dependent malic enzyme [Ruminococcaceae bacterium]|nr:NADP-dependent malic enzyme [Oscillospiraceae bacterium]